MNRIRIQLGALTNAERIVLGASLAAFLSVFVFAAIAYVKRPGDVSDKNAQFIVDKPAEKPAKGKNGTGKGQNEPKRPDRKTDWVRYGYDTERTKFLDAKKVRPPFRKVWRYDQDELIEFAPIIKGKRMFFIDNDGVYIALNVDTGKVVWKKRLGKLNASSPAFSNGALYSVNLQPPQAIAVAANNGKVLWRKDLPGRSESSPIVIRGTMYFGTESGDFFAVRAKDGKTIWTTKLDGATKAAPAFSDGTLYVGDYAGKFYALRASDGAIRWKSSDLGAGFGRSGRFYSTAAVAFGRVYVGNVDGRVYSFDASNGSIAWTHSAGDFVYSGVAAANSKATGPAIFFGSHDKNVYALSARSGEEIWKQRPGGQVSGPATVIGDVAYFSTFSGNSTVGLDLKTGRRVFKFDDGEYGPVVSDGERLYVVGGSAIIALKPVKLKPNQYGSKPSSKGVVTPKELREARSGKRGGGKGTGQDEGKKKSKPKKKADKKKSGSGKKKSGSKNKKSSKKSGKKKSGRKK